MPEYKKYLSILTGCLVGKVQQEKKMYMLHIHVRRISPISSLSLLD